MKNHVRTCSEHQKSIFPTSSDFLRTFHRNARERRQARARQAGRPAVQRGPATDMPNRPRTTPAHPRVPKLGFRLFWHFLIILALPGAHPTFDCAAEPPRSKWSSSELRATWATCRHFVPSWHVHISSYYRFPWSWWHSRVSIRVILKESYIYSRYITFITFYPAAGRIGKVIYIWHI